MSACPFLFCCLASNKESRGVLKDFTLTLYGSQLTEDEVQERKRYLDMIACNLAYCRPSNLI